MIAAATASLPPGAPIRSRPMAARDWRRAGPCLGSPCCSSSSWASWAVAARVAALPLLPGAQRTPGPSKRRWASAKPAVNWGPPPTSCSTGLPSPTACSAAVPAMPSTSWEEAKISPNWPQPSSTTRGPRTSRSLASSRQPRGPASLATQLLSSSATRAARSRRGWLRAHSSGSRASTRSIKAKLRAASGRRLPGTSANCKAGSGSDSLVPALTTSRKGLPRKTTARFSCWLRSLAVRQSRLQIALMLAWFSSQPQGQGSRRRPS